MDIFKIFTIASRRCSQLEVYGNLKKGAEFFRHFFKTRFCGSPTYQLSKCLTNVLKPLTDNVNINYSVLGTLLVPLKQYR